MLRDRFARRRLVAFGVLVMLSVGMIAVSDTRPVDELRNGVRFAITPVQDTLGEATRSVTSVFGAISEVDTLRREKDELAEEVDRLGDQLAVMESLQAENKRLTKLLGTRKQPHRQGCQDRGGRGDLAPVHAVRAQSSRSTVAPSPASARTHRSSRRAARCWDE